jgi:hypothetical protein
VRYPACRAAKWDDLLVDQDDPEKRIAELERRLAEHQRFAEPRPSLDPGVVGTPVGAEAPAYRSFTATAPRMNMSGRDSLIWPREGGLKWPRLRGWRGVVVTV